MPKEVVGCKILREGRSIVTVFSDGSSTLERKCPVTGEFVVIESIDRYGDDEYHVCFLLKRSLGFAKSIRDEYIERKEKENIA